MNAEAQPSLDESQASYGMAGAKDAKKERLGQNTPGWRPKFRSCATICPPES
jgi:hypothetical protein